MRDAPSRMNRLPTQLKMNTVAFVDRARTTLRPRAAGWRTQALSLQDREKRRAAWPLLVYAVGFLIAESATWLLAFALSPKVEYSSPLFMQGAVTVAALLLVPPKRWWIYLVLTLFLLPVNAWLFHGSPSWSVFWTLLFLYLGIVCLAVGTASLVRRFVAAPPRFASVREVSRFMLCVAVVSIVPACIFTAGRIVIFDWTFWFSWETAYFGFVLAMPVFTPTIVLWARTDVRALRAMSRGRSIEVVFVVLGLLVVSVPVFGARYQVSGLPHAMILLLVPLLLWAAVRFGPHGITSALSLTALLAVIGAINGVGPFVGPSAQANVFALQLFLISVGMPLFILAAATQERAEVDKALRTSEERYRGVVETQTELVSRYLPDTTMIFLNDAGCRFYDKPREELLGARWIDLVPKSGRERVQMEIQSLLEHPGTITIEHEAMFPDGSLRWQQWVNRTICDADGRVVELQSVGRDITEHKQAAEALRASEARYRAVVETQTEMITRYRPDTTLTFVNDAVCRFDGKSREELLGTSILADMPEEAAARVQAMIQALLAEPDPGIRTIEHQTRFHDGGLHWQQWVNRTILDTDGQVIELQGIGRDITERKQAEGALRASEARYRAVVRNLPHSAVLLFDEELRHSFADGPGLQVLGLTPARLEGRTVWEAFPPELAAALAPHYDAALAGQAVEQDVAHGQQIYHLQVVPMPAIEAPAAAAGLAAERPEALPENHARAGMVVLQDVTEQWRARDELAHERTLTAVLGAIGQEFRTLADHSPDVIVRLDPLGRALYVNPAGAKLLGRPARHWIGKTVADIGVPEEMTARWAQRLRDVVVTGAPATFDIVVHAPDGQGHALHVRFVPELAEETEEAEDTEQAEGGALRSVLVIATDVTALKQAEARLAEQANELEAIFESQADGVGVYDLAGRFVRVNRALRDLLGLDADAEYTSLPFEERAQRLLLFDEQGRQLPLEQWPQWRVLRGEILAGASAMEALVRTLDGREPWISITGAPIRAPDGHVTGTVLIARDVTARRALERQVAEQAAQLAAIFGAMADGVLVHDAQGRVQLVNQAYRDLVGIEADPDYLTWSLSDRVHQLRLLDEQGQPIPVERSVSRRVLQGEVISGQRVRDVQMQTLDGRDVWVNTSGAPMRAPDGQITGVVLISRNVTARRALERQVQEQATQLEAIFEAMTDGVFVLAADGHVSRLNAASHALFGLAPDKDLTDTAEGSAQSLDLRDADGQPLPVEHLPTQRVLRGEALAGDNAVTLQVRTHDGRKRTISLTGGPLRDATGQIVGAVGVVRDVTELQRVQAALAGQERLFRTLVEHSPDIIARFDRKLRYLYVNPAVRQVSPTPESDYLGKTNAELGWPEAAYAPAHRAIEQVFQTGEPQALEEIDATSPDPALPRYFRAQILPECADDERVESVLTVTTDITALKRTEQALREANASIEAARQEEERRKRVAESLRGMLTILNSTRSPHAVLQYSVGQAEELLGSAAAVIYGPDDLAGSMAPGAPPTMLRVQAAQGLRIGGSRPRPHQRLPCADPAVEQALVSAQPVALVDDLVDDRGGPLGGAAGVEADGHVTAGHATIPCLPCLHGPLPAPYHALLVVPIHVHDGIYGCLLFFYTQSDRFLAKEVALAQAYADQVAQAITNVRLQTHLEQESAAVERNRLARELHDTVTQEIYSASLLAEAIPSLWRLHRREAEKCLQDLRGITGGALAGLRALLLELRPAALEQAPLSEALRRLGAAMSSRAGVPIVLDVEGMEGAAGPEPPLPAVLKEAFYRVAQEAVMNAAKYAKANEIRLRLRIQGKSRLELEIADDGQGFDPGAIPAGHFGLAIMRERARSAGASIQVRSRAGQGTAVIMAWCSGRKAFAAEQAEPREDVATGGSA